jgi:hypothetical protein
MAIVKAKFPGYNLSLRFFLRYKIKVLGEGLNQRLNANI